VALAVVTTLVAAWALARSPLLAVRHVEVRGGAHTTSGDVLAAAGLGHRRPMLSVDAGQVRRSVGVLPWVATVSVGRHWPTGLTITITERQPRAQMTGTAGQSVIVDGEGRVLATTGGSETTPLPPLPLLRIQGGALAGAPGTSVAASAGGALALLRAVTSPGALARQLTAVTQAPDGLLQATFSPGPIDILFGSADELGAKVAAAGSLMAGLAPGTSATIDVGVVDAPVLTNEKNSSMVSTTQRG